MENDLNREVNKITINNKYLKLLNSLNEVILNKNNSPAAMAQALIKKGNILQKLNNYEEALICYEQATQKEPKYALGWIGKGEIFEIVNRNDEALASYARATKEDPTYSLGWIKKGKIFEKLNHNEEALASYEIATKKDPKYELGWIRKGEILEKLDRNEEALVAFDKSIRAKPKDGFGCIKKGQLLEKLNRNEAALAYYERATQKDPKYGLGWILKGQILEKLNQDKEALSSYEEAIKKDPAYGLGWYHLGRMLLKNKDLDRSLNAFKKSFNQYRRKHDKESEVAVQSWIVSVETQIKQQQDKKAPTFDETVLREISQKLRHDPKEDPLAMIKKRESDTRQYLQKPRTINNNENYFVILRKWNSFTPRIPTVRGGHEFGGGYFLVWNGKGIVIDPGFDFVRNFNQLNFSISDIDAIILTHAHTDHTADLETILNLNYELNQVQPGHNIDLFMNLGTLNKFIGWVSKLGGIGNIISLNVGETIEPQGYGWKLNVKSCLHSEIIGKNCIGLVFDLISASCVQLKLGLTSDTGWSKLVQEQYNGCRLLCVHLGSIGENEFNEAISIRSPKRLYQNQQHLGLIGVTRIFNYIKPEVCIISEFGEELGEDRCIVSKTLDLRFRNDSRCFTGDIGLKVRLPDLSIFCPICSNYVDYKIVKEMHLPQGQQVVNYCSTHTDNEKAAYIQGLPL